MPSQGEILRALSASLMLARGDTQGHQLFDHTIEGFWRSFTAVFLVAPAYLIAERAGLAMAEAVGEPVPEAGPGFYAARLAALAVQWVAFPIAMVPVAAMLGLGQRYAPYIIAYNWTSVLIAAAFLPPGLLFALGLMSVEFARILIMAALLWSLYFRYSVARSALETPVATAIGLVVLDVVLSLLISLVGFDLAA